MQDSVDSGPELATVARETFEYNIIPWVGRKYEEWLRAWSFPHPRDPTGLVQVPEPIFKAFQHRVPGQRLTRDQAEELGYPRVPGEQELIRVRKELHDALGRSDWDRAQRLDGELRRLQEQVAARRISALKSRSLAGT
jgi:hypothetical protein